MHGVRSNGWRVEGHRKANPFSSGGHRWRPTASNPHPPCPLICFARKSNLAASHAAKQHDGQITQNLSSARSKNILLSLSGKSVV